ncbi:MAG: restriction endonuclease subunit S [Prevotella sp.]|nr:restriction endonuclease subunit S [Prevotella sp.]
MSEWKKVKLGEICERITSGGTPKANVASYYYPPIIPWLKTKEVNYCRITETENFISEEGLNNSSAKLIAPNSVIVAMYGQGDTAGRVAINKIPLTTNQACCNLTIDESKADYEFIYYQLCTLYNKMVSLKAGAAQPNLNAQIIKNLEVLLPSLPTQHRIATILSRYDSLIENYQRQIKLLEEEAQRLYKEWFVDLHFPGHENTKIIEGVPEGWEKKPISQLGEYLNGFAFKPSDWQESGKPIIKIKEMGNGVSNDTPRNNGERVPVKYLVKAGDLLFSWSATLMVIVWSGEEGWLNQHLFKVTPAKGIGREFLLQSISNTIEEFQNLTSGSTMKHIQRNKLDQVFVNVPDDEIMTSYSDLAECMRNQILHLSSQIRLLTEARDRLLPKLMSGEIEIS